MLSFRVSNSGIFLKIVVHHVYFSRLFQNYHLLESVFTNLSCLFFLIVQLNDFEKKHAIQTIRAFEVLKITDCFSFDRTRRNEQFVTFAI